MTSNFKECHNCSKRHTACWDTCPEYQANKKKQDEVKKKQHQELEAITLEYTRIQKVKQKAHRRN